MSETLLEKAKKFKAFANRGEVPDGMIELALAWCNDEVSLSQVSMALGHKQSNAQVYIRLAFALRAYIAQYEINKGVNHV